MSVQKGGFQKTACPKDRKDSSWLSPWMHLLESYHFQNVIFELIQGTFMFLLPFKCDNYFSTLSGENYQMWLLLRMIRYFISDFRRSSVRSALQPSNVDNQAPVPAEDNFFLKYLQPAVLTGNATTQSWGEEQQVRSRTCPFFDPHCSLFVNK